MDTWQTPRIIYQCKYSYNYIHEVYKLISYCYIQYSFLPLICIFILLQHEDTYTGVDWDGPLAYYITCDSGVEVPAVDIPLTSDELDMLCQEINPLAESTEYGMDIYMNCLQHVQRLLQL